jgi:hypothetical protein
MALARCLASHSTSSPSFAPHPLGHREIQVLQSKKHVLGLGERRPTKQVAVMTARHNDQIHCIRIHSLLSLNDVLSINHEPILRSMRQMCPSGRVPGCPACRILSGVVRVFPRNLRKLLKGNTEVRIGGRWFESRARRIR